MNPPPDLPPFPAPARTGSAGLGAFDVRPVEERDLPNLVEVHLRQFPHGFYAQLGPAFKTRYFRQYFRSPGAIGLVAEQRDGSGLVGYLIGTVDDDAHDRFMHRSAAPALTAAGGSALAARPGPVERLHSPASTLVRPALRVRDRQDPPPVGGAAPGRAALHLHHAGQSAPRHRGGTAALATSRPPSGPMPPACTWSASGTTPLPMSSTPTAGWQVVSESVTRDGRPLVRMTLSLGGATQ